MSKANGVGTIGRWMPRSAGMRVRSWVEALICRAEYRAQIRTMMAMVNFHCDFQHFLAGSGLGLDMTSRRILLANGTVKTLGVRQPEPSRRQDRLRPGTGGRVRTRACR